MKTILAVDDSATMREMVAFMLESAHGRPHAGTEVAAMPIALLRR